MNSDASVKEVLVSLTWRLERGSSTELASVYHVVRVEGDRIACIRVFLDEEAALRAAARPEAHEDE
jgi:hypothetical protein